MPTVRSATPEDAAEIHRVRVDACHAAYADVLEDHAILELIDDPARVDGIRTRLVETATDEDVGFLVEAVDGTVAGFAQVLWGDRLPDRVEHGEAFLKSLYVHPDHWSEGIGGRLLTESFARLPEGLARVQLGVLSKNEGGKRFYEKQGFSRVDAGTYEALGTVYETDVYARTLE